jgi:hypothetical protein
LIDRKKLRIIFEKKVAELFLAYGVTKEVLEVNSILDNIVVGLQRESVGVSI